MVTKVKKFERDNPKSPWIFYIFYIIVFCGGSVQGSFMGLYLTEMGVPVKTLGVINGITQIISLITLPILGRIADRARSKNLVMDIGYIITILIFSAFMVVRNITTIVLLRFVYSIIATPLGSVYDTIAMEQAKLRGWDYQPMRWMGTLGYSVMSYVSGFLLKGDIKTIFPIMIVCYIATFIVGLMLPVSPRTMRVVASPNEPRSKESVYSVLKDRQVRNVLIMFFIYSLAGTTNNTYFGNYTQELGGTLTMIGIAHAILGFSEFPFHLGPGKRWLERIGLERSMVMVLLVGTFRWTVCALTNSATVLMWTMVLNGAMLVPVIIGLSKFLFEHAPEGLKVTAQTSLRSTVSVIAMLISDFGGSAIFHLFEKLNMNPYKGMYTLMIPLSLAGAIIGLTSLKKREATAETENN
ncbi:MAG: MFS transporter [Oscillospiraceae bacterium]|nr:MFS transporter [Oscillospiraceae bacterium]